MIKTKSYGAEANAAAMRAALQCRVAPEKMHAWKQFLFDQFAIRSSKNSYRRLIKLLQEEAGAIETLAEAVADHPDYEEMGNFVAAFINSGWKKPQEQMYFDELLDELITLHNSQSLRKETEMPLKIIDCELKSLVFTEEPRMQVIKYIDVPEQNFDELIPDLAYARHLQFLLEIADELPRKLLLVAKQEVGLLACRYLSSVLNEDEEDDYYYEDDELIGKLPIIKGQDLNNWYGNRPLTLVDLSGPMGLEYAGEHEQNSFRPWYTIYEEVPLIIIIDSILFLGSDFLDKIKLLEQTHRSVWIIYVEGDSSENFPLPFRDSLGDRSNPKLIEDIYWTLNYPTYKIEEPDIESEYYQMVLKTAAARHGYEIAPEVNLVELLKALKKRRGNRFSGNQTIIEMANKAVTFKKKDGAAVLYPEDFSFVSKSLTELWQNKSQEHTSPTINAVERMNKKISGLEQVKKQIMETVNILKLREHREKAGLKTEGLAPHNTCLFIGPPGVGKTELAQCFADILFEENLLPGRKFLNINAAELKAQYVGHTAPKVAELFEENDAIFLDEAYSLAASHNGEMDIFSQEAMAQLCVELEKHARDKLVILAGYGGDIKAENNKMREFLRANPGISSRITFHFNFPSYSPDQEMLEIFGLMAENIGWVLEAGWRDIVVDFFTARSNEENYGNAREGRRLLEQAIVIRAASLDFPKELSDDELKTLSCNDLKAAAARILEAENNLKGQDNDPIGFR